MSVSLYHTTSAEIKAPVFQLSEGLWLPRQDWEDKDLFFYQNKIDFLNLFKKPFYTVARK